jgi:hypothetical protein
LSLLGKKLKILVLYPIIINIGAMNSANTARINVGISPMPIGFPKLGFSEINLINFG